MLMREEDQPDCNMKVTTIRSNIVGIFLIGLVVYHPGKCKERIVISFPVVCHATW